MASWAQPPWMPFKHQVTQLDPCRNRRRDPAPFLRRTEIQSACSAERKLKKHWRNREAALAVGSRLTRRQRRGTMWRGKLMGGQTTTDNLNAVCEDCHKEIHK